MLMFLCVLCILYGVWTWRLRTVRSPDDPPYYPGLYPIIGHTYILAGGPEESWTILSNISKECSKRGGVIRLILGLQLYYVITDPEDALTAANCCLKKHFAYDWARRWLGDGLVTSSGPNWKRHRRLIVPAFSLPILHGFLGVFNSQSRALVKSLSTEAGNGPFNILPILAEATLKTVCMTAFGIDPLNDGDFMKKYMQAVDTILGLIMVKFFNVWLHSDFICKAVGWEQKEDEIIRILNDMSDMVIAHAFYVVTQHSTTGDRDRAYASSRFTAGYEECRIRQNDTYPSFILRLNLGENVSITPGIYLRANTLIIKRKRAALQNNRSDIEDSTNLKDSKYKSLLDLLLQLQENHDLTDKEIREEMDTFIVAGYDTTSLIVSFTLMNLGTYPEIQDRLYEEIQNLFGDTDRDLEKTDLSQLVYTEAVLKETLRVYTTVPVLARYADDDVQLKNYKIRAGSNVALLINGLHKHPVWGKDADIYSPERWLNLTPQQSNAYGSFSLGKRTCIGQHFALMSMKTTLTHILRQYRVYADNSELKFKVDFHLKPVTGCNVTLKRRNETPAEYSY